MTFLYELDRVGSWDSGPLPRQVNSSFDMYSVSKSGIVIGGLSREYSKLHYRSLGIKDQEPLYNCGYNASYRQWSEADMNTKAVHFIYRLVSYPSSINLLY